MIPPRKALCRNCHQAIFRSLRWGWLHVASPRYRYCYAQQTVGWRPVAEPQAWTEPEEDSEGKHFIGIEERKQQ